ncbi:MAG: hypothetical protein P8L79_03065 [Rhodospirillaceae bacterium]|nr:hypothetical protein [Rhodospirillaceae bacterium]
MHLIIGKNSTPRYACFVALMLHEEIMFWLCNSGLTTADFTDERKAGLAAEIINFVEGLRPMNAITIPWNLPAAMTRSTKTLKICQISANKPLR